MSALFAHAQAADILGDAFEGQAGQRSDTEGALLLMSFATAYRVAADEMRTLIKSQTLSHGCSVDHAKITSPHCPLCKAPRG